MLSNLIKVFIGVAIGVWLADSYPQIAESVRGITNSTLDAAQNVMNENPQLAESVQTISRQGMDAAEVVMDRVNESRE
ncbi:hypothetical protein J4N45_09945 [Vibrio sp. SCSIO 43140]|uniref:hypothetical protein n=1 Tax=Vibrio sp. SCSIO 43140 TaxID=2819100 RepID=UPI002074E163|nr:hypothetical protein [Vibrio sp. SCSIO 43140]USD58850.1 hypothetical protein J4N45_09945 [Vibrio sp. SCSIO 43140]